ncbi:MAG: GntR family transcriptional regulator, partial [Hungatella sp.]
NSSIQAEDGKLPTEQSLADAYGVSRVCMRQSMAELEKDGLIVRFRRKGSFVKTSPKPIMHNLDLPDSFPDKSVRKYIDKNPEILELRCFDTTYPHISEALHYEGKIFYIKRIMKVDGNPIAVNRIWIPELFTPDLDKRGLCVDGSLSKTLDTIYHLKAHRRENIVEALRPSGSEVDALKITYDTLILQITSTSFLQDDTPYEHSVTSWIGDSIRLKMDITDIEHGLQFSKKD